MTGLFSWVQLFAASGAVFYGLTVVTIVISWRLIKKALPDDHLGIRHPRVPSDHRVAEQPAA